MKHIIEYLEPYKSLPIIQRVIKDLSELSEAPAKTREMTTNSIHLTALRDLFKKQGQRGMSNIELAELLGICEGSLLSYKRGVRKGTFRYVQQDTFLKVKTALELL